MAVTAADTMARRQSAREEERPATRPTVLPVKKRDKYAAALDTAQTFARIFDDMPVYERKRLYSKAKTFARSIQQQSTSAIRFLGDMRESHVKHVYDLHMKYSMAVVCFIFVFIGAPMGAIVRKGGFGYPILISIIFFMLFVILTIFCRKIAESFILPATREAPRTLHLAKNRKEVGVRVPHHEVPLALVRELGRPIVSTSASWDGELLNDPNDIATYYSQVDVFLDAGWGGLETSTVLDLTSGEVVVKREGAGPVDIL